MGNRIWSISDVALFTNNGNITIDGQKLSGAAAVNIESFYNNQYNFTNNASATLTIKNSLEGIRLESGGLKNEGTIVLRDIEDEAINLIPNTANNYHFKNFASGIVEVDTAMWAVYFNVSSSNTNRIPIINEGKFIFRFVTEDAIASNINYLGFTNTGTIAGSFFLNGTYFQLAGNLRPGDENIGIVSLRNAISNSPTSHIQLKGNAGAGLPNGHDVFFSTTAIPINGSLVVTTLSGFNPALGDEYTIYFSSVSVTGTFSTVILPDFSVDKEFELIYLTDRVKLKVIPKYNNWIGTVNSSWTNPANWSQNTVPDANTYVRIYDAVNDPILGIGNFLINNSASSTFKCKQLEIMADGVITFNNTIVHNYGFVDIYGTLLHNDITIGEIKNFVGATITVWGGGELNMN